MPTRFVITLIAVLAFSQWVDAAEPMFDELEQIYLTVFEEVVRNHNDENSVLAVAMSPRGFGGNYAVMPDALWKQLATRLEAKGVDLRQFVPADEIGWKDENDRLRSVVHKPSGRPAWVYSISGITWHGDNQLHVAQEIYHGGLAAGGSTLVMEKKDGRWTIVDRTNHWVS